MDPFRGAAEVQLLRHGDEVAQVAQLDHGSRSNSLHTRSVSGETDSCWPYATASKCAPHGYDRAHVPFGRDPGCSPTRIWWRAPTAWSRSTPRCCGRTAARSGRASKRCNKPLLGVLVTHPHPDHYNTIGELLAGEDVPVIAHADVDREIRAKDEAKRAQWGPMFGDEWPSSATFPNRTVTDEESVELGDLRFTAWDFGPCESESETIWLLGDGAIAFVGDLAFNGTHAYLADGHTHAWLRAIDRAEDTLAGVRTLYVGHGLARRSRRARRAAPLPADGARGDRADPGRGRS